MLKTRVMPCLLLRGWGLVKTVRFENPTYVGDPINTVRIYNEKEVDELIFLDITATPEHKPPPFQIISEIAGECFMPFTYGGGIHDLDDVKAIFNLGVEKVAVNTHAFENPSFVEQVADRFGSQSVVVSIDVKRHLLGRYRVHTHGGRKATGLDPVAYARQAREMGAGEILLTSIDRDGTFAGYDVDLIQQVAHEVSVPVIACGGAGKVEDFGQAVREGGASAVAAGSMVVYQGSNRAVLINFPTKQELKDVLA
ncbi:MAG TPA: AglZ/HisF2 family acetamidino modification protein [Phycisphaerae bacterium]|nr:AglZ/HisF2 family acetamidino modification protein [Phycisphaerae bacterium]